jgi:hypothetical protein
MELSNFELQTGERDRIYVSWSEHWDLPRYVDHYLRARKMALTADARAAVRRTIAAYPVGGILRKADVDFFLDANLRTAA